MKLKWAARGPRSERPAILNEKHNDWIRPLRWVPRSWTSWMEKPPASPFARTVASGSASLGLTLTWTDRGRGPRKLFGNAIDIICPHYEREYPGGCA